MMKQLHKLSKIKKSAKVIIDIIKFPVLMLTTIKIAII